MAEQTTSTGKAIQNYIETVLANAKNAGNAAMAAGYPADSRYTQAYYAGVPYLYQYGDAEQAQALNRMGGLYDAYGAAGDYNKTNFGDIEGMYGAAGDYDPANFTMADYTTQNIQNRMSPYEELVSQRATARLKKAYDEARGEREADAIRKQAFGGSGAAIQEEVARRNYLEQMADMNASNLQNAFESGAGLYGKEISDRLTAEQAGEASRQFGAQNEMAGIGGMLSARQQQAAQEAAAKEAEFAGLQGQASTAQSQAQLAEQKKNMQLTNLAAMEQAGTKKEDDILARNQYNLDIAGKQANILSPLSGGTTPVNTSKQKTSTTQNILGGLTAAAGIASGISGFFAAGGLVPRYVNGGLVYSGGGLADLQPQYYSMYEMS
jgi:competence protein ComGC